MTHKTEVVLKMLAPYLAVGIFWIGLSRAWPAILAYHAQILFWYLHHRHSSGSRDSTRRQRERQSLGKYKHIFYNILIISVLPFTTILVYQLVPFMIRTDLSAWLKGYHLSRYSFLLLIPYFGLVHPVLEQLHWTPLRERMPILAHLLFAGYHVLVLFSLLSLPWLLMSFGVLYLASVVWGEATRRVGSPVPAIVSHALADSGIILAVWLLVAR